MIALGTKQLSDDELLERCLQHDRRAWDEFVERYSRLIFNVVYETLRRHGEPATEERADDLFNTIFLALYDHNYRKLRQWSGRCSLASWVRLVASSVVIDDLRKRRPLLGLEDDTIVANGERLEDPIDSAYRLLVRVDRIRAVRVALDTLSATDRDLLLRLYREEQPVEQIARELGVKPGALYTRKNRALGRLKAAMTTSCSDPDRGPPIDL